MEMKSWAGHDLATLTDDENAETLLIFCSNSGGSHNPHETTTLDDVEKLVEVQSSLAIEILFYRDKIKSSDESVSHGGHTEQELF